MNLCWRVVIHIVILVLEKLVLDIYIKNMYLQSDFVAPLNHFPTHNLRIKCVYYYYHWSMELVIWK